MFILERRLTVRIVVDRSLFTLWRLQNRVFYYTTTRLRMIYLFERWSSLYFYYRISKFQLHATYNWRVILVNTLYSLLWISNIRSLLISQYLSQQHFCSFTSKTSDILLYRLLELSLRIVRKSDYEELLLLSVIIVEATRLKHRYSYKRFYQFWITSFTRCLIWILRWWYNISEQSVYFCRSIWTSAFLAMISTLCFRTRLR